MHHQNQLIVPLAAHELIELPTPLVRPKTALQAQKFGSGAGSNHSGDAESDPSSESEGSTTSTGIASSVDISPAAQFYSELCQLWVRSRPQYRQTLAAIVKQLSDARKSADGGELDLLNTLIAALCKAANGDLADLQPSATPAGGVRERHQEADAARDARYMLAARTQSDLLAQQLPKSNATELPGSYAVVRELFPVTGRTVVADSAHGSHTQVVSAHSITAAYGRQEPILARAFPNPHESNHHFTDSLQTVLNACFERLHADFLANRTSTTQPAVSAS